jgi:hypothetical protein
MVASSFSQVIDNLEVAFPSASLAFGVGRFEDYGGDFFGGPIQATMRPFILNDPH